MPNIKVKNNAGIEVIYNNIDTICLPTTDGDSAVYRKWNGKQGIQISTCVRCKNVRRMLNTPITEIRTAIALK